MPNKFNGQLKEALLSAFNGAHPDGLASWILQEAKANPTAGLALLIKDANIRASGRDKIHNAFVRRPCVGALVHDLTNDSALDGVLADAEDEWDRHKVAMTVKR